MNEADIDKLSMAALRALVLKLQREHGAAALRAANAERRERDLARERDHWQARALDAEDRLRGAPASRRPAK